MTLLFAQVKNPCIIVHKYIQRSTIKSLQPIVRKIARRQNNFFSLRKNESCPIARKGAERDDRRNRNWRGEIFRSKFRTKIVGYNWELKGRPAAIGKPSCHAGSKPRRLRASVLGRRIGQGWASQRRLCTYVLQLSVLDQSCPMIVYYPDPFCMYNLTAISNQQR